jgi:hypothetical protein
VFIVAMDGKIAAENKKQCVTIENKHSNMTIVVSF